MGQRKGEEKEGKEHQREGGEEEKVIDIVNSEKNSNTASKLLYNELLKCLQILFMINYDNPASIISYLDLIIQQY